MYQSATVTIMLINKYLPIICDPMLHASLAWAEALQLCALKPCPTLLVGCGSAPWVLLILGSM